MVDEISEAPPQTALLHKDLLALMKEAIKSAKQEPFTTGDGRMKYFSKVDEFLEQNPVLLVEFYKDIEPPLLYAARRLSPELVSICLKHGADPKHEFPCPKDIYHKNAHLAATDAYSRKLKKHRHSEEKTTQYEDIYVAVLTPIREKAPISQGATAK